MRLLNAYPENPCSLELGSVKQHNVLAQIYSSGIKHGLEISECLDEHGDVDEEDQAEFDLEFQTRLDVFKDIVDLVWNDDFEYVCEECEEKITDKSLEEDFKKNIGKS
jgi:hypothetical protein